MRFIEKVLVMIVLCGIAMDAVGVGGGAQMSGTAVLALIALYLFFGVLMVNGVTLPQVFMKGTFSGYTKQHWVASILSVLGMSIALLAIFFNILSWEGYLEWGIIGLILSGGTAAMALIQRKRNPTEFYGRIFSRTVILFIVCLVFVLMPDSIRLKLIETHKGHSFSA